jgi:hypothetical protein
MVATDQIAELTEELKQFQEEKEKIRIIVGQIGGTGSPKRDKAVTTVFVVLLLLLFAADVSRHILGISVPLPPLFSIEVGVLLVSIKIIWMLHNQTRIEHFQFWILNSIEFRIDQMSNRLRNIESQFREIQNGEQNTSERRSGPHDGEPEASEC